MQVFIAPQKDEMRKPEKGMWEFFVENCNGGVKPGNQYRLVYLFDAFVSCHKEMRSCVI